MYLFSTGRVCSCESPNRDDRESANELDGLPEVNALLEVNSGGDKRPRVEVSECPCSV
ncbi:hypothetical protein RBSH_05656 [Rhodopirellula baltica SH28]|uniref:Uncharacterized protein n=2 Tax=Rhodopirellula baltica TaxID=265606 RepID=K5C806_RHOBT|nr:hypothetical protein RBSH_05656 [Rhodopirellula baltica SH28]ELP33826.1 hypothetical protein RBSWK_01962 [Rhodopirellula baltica SWK14]